MREAGDVRYQKHLDPQAQEFWPRNPLPHNQINLLQTHIYYSSPYPFSYPPTGVPVTAQVSFAAVIPPPPPLSPPLLAVPTRSLFLSFVPMGVSESTVKKDMEVFGEVRAIEMERWHEGIVTVHFYDLRNAEAAMVEIQEQHMQQQSRLRRYYDALLYPHLGFEGNSLDTPVPLLSRGLIAGRPVWAQFIVPKTIIGPDGHNQGTIEVFNLDSEVSASKLKEIFENFGPVKELRNTPSKQHQWFVEFFDIRDAARALSELNGKQIYCKKVIIEFSHPSGHERRKGITKTSNIHTINSRKNYSRYDICAPPMRLLHSCSSSDVPPRSVHLSQNQLSNNKSRFSKENSNQENNGRSNYGTSAKNSKKLATIEQVRQPRSRSVKNSDHAHFLINEDTIVKSNFRDTRTTVMIKNIPNKYSQKLLLNMLDNHCRHCNEQIAGTNQPLSSYDFVYLPIDFNNKCNVGYGFVNLTSPQATWRLYKAFHLLQWEVFNSRKICEVTYARLQGLEALKQHFKNSKFACVKDDYLPVLFSPARDGKELTEPVSIVGHALQVTSNEMRLEKGDDNGNGDEDSCSSK